jgi:hypothetical protein
MILLMLVCLFLLGACLGSIMADIFSNDGPRKARSAGIR